MTSRSLCAIALSTAACLSTPGPADPDAGIDVPTDTVTDTATDGPGACTDGDGDGWSTCGMYPDCADDDAARHPGAFEAVGGPDSDCFATAPTVAAPTLTHAAVGGDRVITGPVVVRLDDAAGGQLGSLIVGGTEMLYSGAVLERYSGVEAWDNTDPDNPSVNNARSIAAAGVVTALQLGRAVARLRVEWTASDITGASIYTVTPEGRVVRTDDFVLSNGGRFVSLTSFAALRPDGVDLLVWEALDGKRVERGLAFASTTDLGELVAAGQPDDDGFACAGGVDRELGWTALLEPQLAEGQQPRRGLRLNRSRSVAGTAPTQLALQFDWEFSTGIGLLNGRRVAHAALWAGPAGATRCAASAARLREFRAPRPLIDRVGHVAPGASDYDVGGDGFVEDGGYWALEPTSGVVRFAFDSARGTAPRSTLFHLRGDVAGDDWSRGVVVIREAAGGARTQLVHGEHYLADSDGDRGLWLVLLGDPGDDHLELLGPAQSCPTCGE